MGRRMPNFSRGTDRGGYQGFLVRGRNRAWCDGFARAHTPLIPVARAQILANSGDAGLSLLLSLFIFYTVCKALV